MTRSDFYMTKLPKKKGGSVAYLNSRASLLLEQNIFRFHITVDDFVSIQSVQTLQEAVRELPDELQREPLELVLLDQLVQVY